MNRNDKRNENFYKKIKYKKFLKVDCILEIYKIMIVC